MATSDGQRANAATFNAAYLSRTESSDTVGIIGLNHPSSGGLIANPQQTLNTHTADIADHENRITSNEGDIIILQNTKQEISEKDQPSGYAGLDAQGRISTNALPVTALEFQGVWDAATNSPVLADGTGDLGDIYRVSVAATRDLGSGNQNFVVGDWVTYDGSIWQRSDFGLDVQVLNDLNDVDTTTTAPISGDILEYDGTNFVPVAASSGSSGSFDYSTQSADYTLLSADNVVGFTTGNGADITASLPQASVIGIDKIFTVKKIDSGTAPLILEGFNSGTELIDGSGTFHLHKEGNFITVICTGTAWEIIDLDVTDFRTLEVTVGTVSVSVANSWQDITAVVNQIDLDEGTWDISAACSLSIFSSSATGNVLSNVAISTVGNIRLPRTIKLATCALDNIGNIFSFPVFMTDRVTLSAPESYKIVQRSTSIAPSIQTRLTQESETGSLTDPDAKIVLYAKRVF